MRRRRHPSNAPYGRLCETKEQYESDRDNPLYKQMVGSISFDLRMVRMFLCPQCGNKRCPHAADHRLACTNSNETGQKGSLYA
jgi:hypothetical protein